MQHEVFCWNYSFICVITTLQSLKMSHWASWATFPPPGNHILNPYSGHVLFLNNSFQIQWIPSTVCPSTLCCAIQASSVSLLSPNTLC